VSDARCNAILEDGGEKRPGSPINRLLESKALPSSPPLNPHLIMKKYLLLSPLALLLALLLSLSNVQAAAGPTRTPAPAAAVGGGEWTRIWQGTGSLHAFDCDAAGLCLAVGSGGVTLKTENQGQTWHQEILAGKPDLRDVGVRGALALAVGANGAVYRSDNAGLTWTQIATPTGADLDSVSLLANGHAWAAGSGGVILHSADGGLTWSVQSSNTANPLHAVQFLDASTGYAAGEKGTLLKTADSGTTWRPVANNFPGWARINALSFTDADTGWIAGQAGYIRMTEDGGQTWQEVNSGVAVDIFNIHMQNDFGVFGGARGAIATSSDGRAWSLRASIAQDARDVNAVYTSGSNSSWAAGAIKSGNARAWFISHSDDGLNFAPIAGDYGVQPLLQEVAQPSKDVAYVVGFEGAIGKTTDGGESWAWQHFKSKYPASAQIAAISCPTVTDCWIAGQAPNNPGFVYVTHDGGQNWTFQSTGSGANWPWMYDIEMLDDKNGHAAANPDMFYTTDGGVTWQKSSVVGNTANVEIAMASPYEGWTAQRQLGRRYTTSGGQTWSRFMPYNEQAGIYFFGVETLDVNQDGGLDMGWLVGCQGPLVDEHCPENSGVIYYAVGNEDVGVRQLPPPDTPPLYAITMLDDQHGWVGGAEGVLLYTDNGGAKWQNVASGVSTLLTDIAFFQDKVGFATTYGGEILRFRGPGRHLNSYAQTTPITADGEIYDWHYGGALYLDADNASAVFGDEPYPSPAQLSGDFYSRWTGDALYIMGQIQDDIIGPGDAVSVALDGMNDDVWDQQNNDDLLIAIAANGDFDAGSPANNAAIAHAVKHTDNGWQWELRIPAALLARTALAENDAVGMNLALDDNDGPGVSHRLLLEGRSLTGAPATWGDIRLLGNTLVLQNGLNEYDGTEDAHITVWGEDGAVNHGEDDTLQTIFTSGRQFSNTLIRFDLALPHRAQTGDVLLKLYVPYTYARAGFKVAAHRLLRPWDEAAATWIMADATTRWAERGALKPGEDYDPTPLDTVAIPTGFKNDWLTWDVGDAVNYWRQHPDENYGIILMGVNASQKLHTYSSEYNDAPEQRPKLIVDFTLQARPMPSPTPTVTPTPADLYLPLIQS